MRTPRIPGAGFSLVELMVSVVVGMLALMFATRLTVVAEKNKQGALGGSDAMQNGMLALFSINKDAAQAGWGLNDPLLAGCDTVGATAGYTLAGATRGGLVVRPLSAALIASGGAAPDGVTFYAGSSMSGAGSLRLVQNYAGGSVIAVDRVPYGFALGDVIVVASETRGAAKCALAQIATNPALAAPPPAPQVLDISDPLGDIGAPPLGANYYLANQARLFNLGPAGALAFHTWSVQNGWLRLQATDLAGAGAASSAVVDNVVSIKAEYGFDTRLPLPPQGGLQVALWSATMIHVDAAGLVDVVPDHAVAADYERIAALRLAVVARSKMPDKPDASGACSATATAPVVFASAEPLGVAAAPITLDVAVAGDPIDWRCYRYRVFETIVPLRNAGWRP